MSLRLDDFFHARFSIHSCLRHLYTESSGFACIFRTSPHMLVTTHILYMESSSLVHGIFTASSSLSMLLGPPAYHLRTLYNDGGLVICSLPFSTTPPKITGLYNNDLGTYQKSLSTINTRHVSIPSFVSRSTGLTFQPLDSYCSSSDNIEPRSYTDCLSCIQGHPNFVTFHDTVFVT
jgi:hypothetical protein